MGRVFQAMRRLQWLADLLPKSWRLPLRYGVQRVIGGLEPEVALLPQLVGRDMVVLDVGANMGIYSYALSTLSRHVHAFEPQLGCCEVIGSWAEGKNVTVHNVGVGSGPAELTLHVPVAQGKRIGTRASFTRIDGPQVDIKVPVIALDSLRLEDIGFIKIDVEGFEYDVLVGAEDTLRRCVPALLIELDRHRQSFEEFHRTLGFLDGLGYSCFVLVGDKLRGCGKSVWAASEKHYNFVFLGPEAAVAAARSNVG